MSSFQYTIRLVLEVLPSLVAVLLILRPTLALGAVPAGFVPIESDNGVILYMKDYAGGQPDYVMVADLNDSRLVQQIGSISEKGTGTGPLGGDNPTFWRRSLEAIWSEFSSAEPSAFGCVNGQFFSTASDPTAVAFSIKDDGIIVSDGYGVTTEYPGEIKVFRYDDDKTDASIVEFSTAALSSSVYSSAIVGLDEEANKNPSSYVGRTFLGIADNDADGISETVLVFVSSYSTQQGAASVLYGFGANAIIMMDGGGSSQLTVKGTGYVNSDRSIPHAICVVSGSFDDECPTVDGTLIKKSGTNAVYYMLGGRRWWIINEEVFNSLGLDFADVCEMSDSKVDAIPLGPNIGDENALFKCPSCGSAVYEIIGGQRWGFQFEWVFLDCYGYDFDDVFDEATSAFMDLYAFGGYLVGVCQPNSNETEDCGYCGHRIRTCNSVCQWGNWGPCLSEGDCAPTETESQDCGNCGERSRTCNPLCLWGGWSQCMDEGECTPGETATGSFCGNCGHLERVCENSCVWDVWSCVGEGICQPDVTKIQACGNCGKQTSACTSFCQWEEWGECFDQGECSPGETKPCNDCGTSICDDQCSWGTCKGTDDGLCSDLNCCTVDTCGSEGFCSNTSLVCRNGWVCHESDCECHDECLGVDEFGICQGEILIWCVDGDLEQEDCSVKGQYCDDTVNPVECACPIETCSALGISACVTEGSFKSCGFPDGEECLGWVIDDCNPGQICIDIESGAHCCTPDCGAKHCGGDGCGRLCGTCSDGLECTDGQCVIAAQDDVPNVGEGPVELPEAWSEGPVKDNGSIDSSGGGCNSTKNPASLELVLICLVLSVPWVVRRPKQRALNRTTLREDVT